jgi:ATP phosphoribosyltransferase regulatory subunit
MVYQPPIGARDLFPLDVAQKRWIEDRIQQVFHQWGYHRIITSLLERLDTLMAGGAIDLSTVIQLQDREGETLGLRPELTASIARAAVTRMAAVPLPHRLYYQANVFRRATRGNHNRQQEFYQAGVELLGGGGVATDAEILLMLSDCLQNLGLTDCSLVLGEAELTRSLLSVFPEVQRELVRGAIANLDRIQLETLPLSPDLRTRALTLLDLRGTPETVIQRVSQLALSPREREIVTSLKEFVALLEQSRSAQTAPALILDLSLIQPFDYYTGIVFEVVSGAPTRRILGQGGRYDQLLSLYHPQGETIPGIGFVLNIEDLHQVLLPTGQLPTALPAIAWLVVPETPQATAAAFTYAQTLRQTEPTTCVEMCLDASQTADTVKQLVATRRVGQVAWVSEAGQIRIEGGF